jgi:AcrR family transcriptional regulator
LACHSIHYPTKVVNMSEHFSDGKRPYRSDLRATQAAETRVRVLTAAAVEFSRRGYAGTSIPTIAAAAGVSPETVKLQGAKHELLLAAFELTFAGREGDAPIAQDADIQAAIANLTPTELPGFFAATATSFNERGAGLWAAFSSAARSDEAVAAVHRDLLARRLEDHALAVDLLAAHGLVTSTAPRLELAAALAHLASPEGYLLLVEDWGWSIDRYRAWVAETTLRLVTA